jgi:hypothetical protein
MDVALDLPHSHVSLRLPGAWPDIEDLAELAGIMADTSRQCPDCTDVTVRDVLLAMAEIAPDARLAAALRARAGSAPLPMSPRLAAMYEKYADQLAEIETARAKIGR